MVERPEYWLEPITKPHAHACMGCNHMTTTTFLPERLIAVGFGFAACTKDGLPVLEEPQVQFNEDGDDLLNEPEDADYPTGAQAEALAAADPDHDWQIVLHGPLSGRTYQRQGENNWVLVAQDQGFA